jgi:flagellar hook capping protein FlgD
VLAGSAVAFAVSEGLKLQKRPLTPTNITKVFSPVCKCPQARADIDFKLLKQDTITLTVVDAQGHEVRRLVDHRRLNKGGHHFTWNGKDDIGTTLLSGSYRPKIAFSDIHRTFLLPNPITIDVKPPHVRALSVTPREFSPDGDGRGDQIVVAYRVSEHAHVLLLANKHRRVFTLLEPLHGRLAWNGSTDGHKVAPGTYKLELVAVDLAGNRSEPVSAGVVRLRYVDLTSAQLTARPGQVLSVAVDTDAKAVRWTLRRGSSVVGSGSGGKTLEIRAPRQPGRFDLVLQASGHERRAVLVVAK